MSMTPLVTPLLAMQSYGSQMGLLRRYRSSVNSCCSTAALVIKTPRRRTKYNVTCGPSTRRRRSREAGTTGTASLHHNNPDISLEPFSIAPISVASFLSRQAGWFCFANPHNCVACLLAHDSCDSNPRFVSSTAISPCFILPQFRMD